MGLAERRWDILVGLALALGNYIRQVNGVKLADILFSLLCVGVCVCVCLSVCLCALSQPLLPPLPPPLPLTSSPKPYLLPNLSVRVPPPSVLP